MEKEEKKPKSRPPEKLKLHIVRKNRWGKIGTILLWSMACFITIKGLTYSFRPDTAGEALQAIADFKSEFSGYKELDSELLAFAEGFTWEYLTWKGGGEQDYHLRLSKYAVDSVSFDIESLPRDTSASVQNVRAYRKEAFSEAQYDVFVSAEITYFFAVNSLEEERTETERVTLKVPVAMKDNFYIVENKPMFVNESIKLSEFEQTPFELKPIPEDEKKTVVATLSDFFTVYYADKQSVIDMYLSPNAEKSEFTGLYGVLSFNKMNDGALVYYGNDAKSTVIACISVSALDKAETPINQSYTVTLTIRDGKYLVEKIDTRVMNVKGEK